MRRSLEGRDRWGEGRGILFFEASVVPWKDIRYAPGGPSTGQKGSILFLDYSFIWGMQRSCDGWGGAKRPVWRGNEPKKTGARSARARTRGQNPLVLNIIKDSCNIFF